METSNIVIGNEVSIYSRIVGCDNSKVTLGRFYVNSNVSTMGRYNYAPMKGNLGDMLRIFGYLKHNMKLHIICGTRFLDDKG